VINGQPFAALQAEAHVDFLSLQPSGALNSAQLSVIKYPIQQTISELELPVREGGFFDLWSFVEKLEPRCMNVAIGLKWFVESSAGHKAFVSVGCDDCCVLFVNQRPVWGRIGRIEHCSLENLIEVNLEREENEILLVTTKAIPWERVPRVHYQDEWTIDVEINTDLSNAWQTFKSRNFHLVDSPVVATWADLRSHVICPSMGSPEVFDETGKSIRRGSVTVDESIQWEIPTELPRVFNGVIKIGDFCEPIVIAQDLATLPPTERKNICSTAMRPWRERFQVLNGVADKDRDRWWARKFAQAYDNLTHVVSVNDPNYCPARMTHFGSFVSKIDGSEQFYFYFDSSGGKSRKRPVAVLWPGVPSPVRPFLHSYPLADIGGAEIMMAAGRDVGVDIVWPGFVDVDYGGAYSVECLRETIAALKNGYSTNLAPPIFLVGFCSGGVGVLEYLRTTPGLGGAILWSPYVRPISHKCVNGLDIDPSDFPSIFSVKKEFGIEQIKSAGIPLFVLEDIDVEGHGDREGTAELIRALQSGNLPVEVLWRDHPDNCLLWGARSRPAEIAWMQWIANQSRFPLPREKSGEEPPEASKPRTVTEALLRGFLLDVGGQTEVAANLRRWGDAYKTYRGSNLPWGDPKAANTSQTIVSTEEIADLQRFLSIVEGTPKLNLQAMNAAIHRGSPVWGFRLTSSDKGKNAAVKIFFTNGQYHPPKVDLMIDGCCRAAAWYFDGVVWSPLQAWF
jgi:hypothetical protein